MRQRKARQIFSSIAGCIFFFTLTANLAAAPAAEKTVSSEGVSLSGESTGNPFIGVWQAGDATYEFFANGTFTVISTHCCGLRFQDEYSYFILKDTLFTYGALMGGPPELKQFTFDAQGADAIRVVSTGGNEWMYTRFDGESEKVEDFFGYGGGHLEVNPLLGTWDAPGKGLRSMAFQDDGTVVSRPVLGKPAAAVYLVRENGLALIVPGRAKPLIKEYTYEEQGEGIALNEKGKDVPAYFLRKEMR
jgi:hypothetical protein